MLRVKVAALDVGEARIGRAVGELGRPFAFGRGYLVREEFERDLEALSRWLDEEGAERVVVGLPHRWGGRTRGRPRPQARRGAQGAGF